MLILGIESASLTASAALLQDDTVIAEYTTNFKKTHSQTILPMIDEIMRMTEKDCGMLDAVAVSEGPGSFTGLRIGASLAKGLAFPGDLPIIPVPTLDAIAYGAFGSDAVLCPLMDARRMEVYSGLYGFNGEEFVVYEKAAARPMKEQLERAEALAKELGKPVMYLGDGLPVFEAEIRKNRTVPTLFAPAHTRCQRAGSVAALGARLFEEGVRASSLSFEPVYLRKSQAEQERERKGL